jgi:Uma2 family endonuclease
MLLRILPIEWALRVQSALVLARGVPEPDLAVVTGPAEKYLKRHPRAADVHLLIEAADRSPMADRRIKGVWYAEAKIPEFWLINLVDGRVEVYTQPKGGKAPVYRQRRNYTAGEEVPPVLGGRPIARLPVSNLCPVKE